MINYEILIGDLIPNYISLLKVAKTIISITLIMIIIIIIPFMPYIHNI